MSRNLTAKIQMRRDTGANWVSRNPILAAGEIGYDITNKQTKIGDGVTHWNDLDWFATKTKPNFAYADWATIAEVAASGLADSYFRVGDEKTIRLSTDEEVTLVIMGFNHDNLTGGGKAPITIGMKHLLATKYAMNSSNTNVGGWDTCAMRTSTMVTLLSQLPNDLQRVIKNVDKLASAGNKSTEIVTSSDKLWLFSEVEIDGTATATYCNEGTQYEYWRTIKDGTVNADRIKNLSNGTGAAYSWWLRSPITSGTSAFRNFTSGGGVYYYAASGTYGVSFGFCI